MENVMEFLGKQSKKESYLDRDTFPSESRWWRIFNERKLVLELLNVVKVKVKVKVKVTMKKFRNRFLLP